MRRTALFLSVGAIVMLLSSGAMAKNSAKCSHKSSEKVEVCHFKASKKASEKASTKGPQTKCVSVKALEKHLAHGDYEVGLPCPAGDGVCAVEGTTVCGEDGPDCNAEPDLGAATDEICDGLDNDCNGSVDDGSICAAGEVCEAAGCVPAPLDCGNNLQEVPNGEECDGTDSLACPGLCTSECFCSGLKNVDCNCYDGANVELFICDVRCFENPLDQDCPVVCAAHGGWLGGGSCHFTPDGPCP